MQIFMSKGFSGEIVKLEVDPESCPENQMPNFVYKLFGENAPGGLSEGSSGFVLFNVTRGFEYSSKEAFGDNTFENDLLLLMNSDNFPAC